jgi:hypothetical protein
VENQLIFPGNNIDQNTYNQNIALFNVNAQLDYLKDLQLSIAGSSTATITFFMGAEFNSAKALEKKYSRAEGAMMAGGDDLAKIVQQNQARRQLGV